MKLKLRPHQKDAVSAIEREFKDGKRKTLAVLATGAGKTIIYLYLVNKWVNEGKRVLILAHRRELIHQPLERAEEFFPGLEPKMGIVMASKDEAHCQVVVATIQTVSRNLKRAEVMEEVGEFDYVILDECHHGTASTYMKLFEHFIDARWLGLTATPFRHDGQSMSEIFESVAFRYPITSAIEDGTLVPFDAFGFKLPVSLEGVPETKDGWKNTDLGSLLSAENALEIVYNKWKEYCSGRKTICFTASVGQAYATSKYFREQGITAEAVSGSTPKKQRDEILDRFRNGETQVVMNCQVWTEGVDVPEASAALMVCPTKSDLAYVQKLGRVLRTYKDKKDSVVLDFAPREDRNIIMAGDILGLSRRVKKARERAEKSGLLVEVARVSEKGLPASIDPNEILVEALKYLRQGTLAWTLRGNYATATLSETSMLVVEMPDLDRVVIADKMRNSGHWDKKKERLYQYLLQQKLWLCTKNGRSWISELIGHYEDSKSALSYGDKFVMTDLYTPHIAKRRGQWRKKAASEPQLLYMKRLGIETPEDCTSGQASQLIAHHLATQTVERYRKEYEFAIMEKEFETNSNYDL